jgi:hypothetical protein
MGPGSNEFCLNFASRVDENPIRLDVAIATALPLPFERMIDASLGQRRSIADHPNDSLDLFGIFSAADHLIWIALEFSTVDRFELARRLRLRA